MSHAELVDNISRLYPIDSPCETTRAIGRMLFMYAVEDIDIPITEIDIDCPSFDWRTMDDSFLTHLYYLNISYNPPLNISI